MEKNQPEKKITSGAGGTQHSTSLCKNREKAATKCLTTGYRCDNIVWLMMCQEAAGVV